MKIFFSLLIFTFCLNCQPQRTSPIPPPEKPTVPGPAAVESSQSVAQKGDGDFQKISGDVHHKRSSELTWKVSTLETPLYLKDWIKTSGGASSTIHIKEKRIIEMSENSILILLDRQDSPYKKMATVGITRGEVRGQISSQKGVDSEILFKMPTAWLRVKASLKEGVKNIVRLSLTSNKMKIHMEEGSAQLVWNGKNKELKENEAFEENVPTVDGDNFAFTESPPPAPKAPQSPVAKVSSTQAQPTPAKPRFKKFLITAPKNGATVKASSIQVSGQVPEGHKVFFRGQAVLADNGTFKKKIDLDPGLNILTFQVLSDSGAEYFNLEVEKE